MTLQVKWLDRGREPQCPPDPDFPEGRVIDMSEQGATCCTVQLDPLGLYPTPRCGYLLVTCDVCEQKVLITTAGRPDDPRMIKMACIRSKRVH